MNEFEPQPGDDSAETRPEDWQEPVTTPEVSQTSPDSPQTIIARVEAGEELTNELLASYQIAREAEIDSTEGDRTFLQLQLSFESAELMVKAGRSDALEALETLSDEIYQSGQYDELLAQVDTRITELKKTSG